MTSRRPPHPGPARPAAPARARACAVPPSPLLDRHPLQVHYQDAYEVALSPGTSLEAALRAFAQSPAWVGGLMWLRDQVLARLLRLRPAREAMRRAAGGDEPFPTIAAAEGERLMGARDSHLDFQVLARLEPGPAPRLVVATRVHFNGPSGRLYFAPVGPVHRLLVPALLTRMARRLAAERGDARPAPGAGQGGEGGEG